MITKFTIGRRHSGDTWDVINLVSDIKWVTDLNFAAGTLTFDLLFDSSFYPQNGDLVEFQWDEQKIFYGYIFKVNFKEDKKFSITSYDKTRYLKNEDSLVWPISTISDRFDTVCKMAEISHTVVNSSNYKLPAEVADAKTYFDMLKASIDKTQKATNQMYYVFANYDVVELRKAPHNELNIIVGDQSLLTGFSFEKSIDEAANSVRIIKKNQAESQQTSSTSSDSEESSGDDPAKTSFSYADSSNINIRDWGKLQTVESAKDKANDAQMKQRADELLKEKDRETYTLSLTCLGDTSLVAGNSVNIQIDDLSKAGFWINNTAIMKATHNFGNDYTCDLEMKVNEPWLENNSST
ncbi:XkdQ/YqbQ family protein [Companilactobacillus nantensis]|uniref:YqbQ/XkdQ domain-containing protein n=1 Tax=Companilactobacillus nantensis DSM 16982 TaxID=1423774 RepID=A0A0R1WP59_9LACO|nr:hypothetical protein [Companilactobacillus nantensis]KRM17497.1 hypothetical protein FD31_GL002690 [Companilactobacillus nantensis DSM 16982]GEO64472.1 hypothetical protein LNA01_16550 [Companilactobacillus nantensis]